MVEQRHLTKKVIHLIVGILVCQYFKLGLALDCFIVISQALIGPQGWTMNDLIRLDIVQLPQREGAT